MKRSILFSALLCLCSVIATAQDFKTLNDQFIALFQKGDYAAAIPIGQKALKKAQEEFGTDNVNYAVAAENVATAYFSAKKWSESIPYYQEAILAYTAAVGNAEVIEVGLDDNYIGTAYFKMEEYDSAATYFNKAYRYFKEYPVEQYDNLQLIATNLIETNFTLGRNIDAQKVCEAQSAVIEQKEGKASEHYYTNLYYMGLALRNQQKFNQALPQYEEALVVAEQLYGKQHIEYAGTLDLIGDCHRNLAQFAEAEKYLLQAQAVRKSLPNSDPLSIASGYHNIGNLYADLAMFERSYQCFDSALLILDKAKLQKDILYPTVIRSYGYTCVDGGKTIEAKRLLQRVLKLYEEQYGKDYVSNGEVQITLANAEFQLNELAAASTHLNEGILSVEKHFGLDNYLISRAREIQGLIAHRIGNSNKGLELCKVAADMNTRIFGKVNMHTASTLSNLGLIYQETGDYAAAEDVLRKSFMMRQEVFGIEHPQTALSMNNLAMVMVMQSRYSDADKLLAASLEIFQKKGLLSSANALLVINNIAMLSERQGDQASANKLYLRILELLQKDSAQNSMVYGTVLNNLSINSMEEKKYTEALNYGLQAMDYAKQKQGTLSASYIKSGNNCLVAYSKLGNFEKGRQLGLELKKLATEVLGDSSELLGKVYSNLSSLEARAGNLTLAAQYLQTALAIQMSHYENNLYALSERDQVSWWKDQSFYFQLLPSLLFASEKMDPEMVSAMINQQLQLKGFILNNAAATMHKARSINDPQLQQLIDQWQSSRTLYLRESSLPLDERTYGIDSLSVMANSLEQAINKKAGGVLLTQQTAINWKQVQQALQPNETAVEFFQFPTFSNNWYSDTLQYGAIVINKNDPPILVKLGSEKEVQWCLSGGKDASTETNINKLYRSNIKGKTNTGPSFTGDSLYQLIWKPLLPYLSGTKMISYAPDGLLHKVAFAALPVNEKDLLLDNYQLQQYSSVRQVTERKTQPIAIKTVFAAGHADFNAGLPAATTGAWTDLPGTKKEMTALQNLFSTNNIPFNAFDSLQATEENFKALSNHAPTLIHIATHGFFLPDPPAKKAGESASSGENSFARSDDPLMRSGIILAGANKYWRGNQITSGKEDGILTAFEIAQLNLQGTQLAVLSACETGLGDVQDAEGVFGLQRALKMAGINNLVLSLWQVPDEETMELMTIFYGHLLKGKTVRQSFYETQQIMRAKYPPYLWAAFVLME